MEAIRTKDKLFVTIALPVAVVAAYFWLWRGDVSRKVEALDRECASLVAADDFPQERRRAEMVLDAAKRELAAERVIPMPAEKVVADAAASVATRELAVLEIFRSCSLVVVSGKTFESKSAKVAEVLRATKKRTDPVCRTYEVSGGYPDVIAALRTFAERKMAVIPESVRMGSPGSWVVTLWM